MKRSALVIVALLHPLWPQDLPVFRGSLGRTGVYNAEGVRNLHKVKWQFKTGGRVLSSPVVSGGIVYAGSFDSHLYAIDAGTGALKWKFATGSAVTSTPAVAGGTVFFGSFDGKFYAVDAAAGKEKWKFETAGERRFSARNLHGLLPAGEVRPDCWDMWLSSPLVANGIVYAGSGDGNVYALDAATGALRWKFTTGDVVHSSPAIQGGVLYIGSWDSYLYALDAGTGAEKWRFKTGEDKQSYNQVGIQGTPAVAGDIVYFGCRDAHVYAVDARSGQKRWDYPTKGSWVVGSPAVSGGRVYVGTSDSSRFLALKAESGALEWERDLKTFVFSSPAIAAGLLYVGAFDGRLHALDLKTHEPVWAFQTEASKENLAKYTDAEGRYDFTKIMRSNFWDEMVAAMEKLYSTGAILSSPAVYGKVVYFGSTDGSIYAIE